MWNFIRKSFKRELLVSFVAVALLPLVLSCIFLIQMFKVKLERDYQKKDMEQAVVMEEKLTTLFQTIDEVTLRLSEEPEIAASIRESGNRGRSAVYAKLYEETASLREMAQFDLYSEEGVCLYSTGAGMFHTQLPVYWGILKVAEAHPDEMTVRREKEYSGSSNILLRAARPILDSEDSSVGYVLVSINGSNFEKILGGTYGSQDGVCILNSFWETVYSTGTAVREEIGTVLRHRLMAGAAVDEPFHNNSIYISEIGGTGLYSVFLRPKVFTADTTKSMYSVLIVMTAASLMLCVAVAAKMSNHLSRPIQSLNEAMHEVQNGNLDARVISTRNDEFGQLSGSFNTMASELKAYMEMQVSQQKKLNEVQIAMMQAQLNPHFLYNTLDTMKWVAKANHIPEIATLAAKLAKILRTSISNAQFITLKEELELVDCYAEIQKIRFQGKFCFDYELPQELADCVVPKLVVQPIVENAMIHGLRDCEEGHILVRAFSKEERLFIEVMDDGCGISDEVLNHLNNRTAGAGVPSEGGEEDLLRLGHIGFYNVDTIIRLHYGAEYGLSVCRPEEGGTKVTIMIPVRQGEEL